VPATTFATRYNFPTTFGGKKLDGSGQCIAIIELGGGFDNSDLQLYFQKIRVPQPNVVAISVDGAGNHPTRSAPEMRMGTAKLTAAGGNAGSSPSACTGGNGFLTRSAWLCDTERKPRSCRSAGRSQEGAEQALKAFHGCCRRGSVGADRAARAIMGRPTSTAINGRQNHVDHPVRRLRARLRRRRSTRAGGRRVKRRHHAQGSDGGGWATGGGISTIFPVPAYQKKANTTLSLVNHKHGRGVPDIAMSATDYFVRVHSLDQPSGGTSAVAPLMSALVALLNQAKKKNVGFLNPFLYDNAAKGVVTPVTSGTNAIAKTVKGYKAKNGWSACTGLGILNGKTLSNL
jgi:kumamolisin